MDNFDNDFLFSDNENDEETHNTIVELGEKEPEEMLSTHEVKEISDNELKVTKKKKKTKKSIKWQNLSKKQKIVLIVSLVIVVLIITGLCLWFFVFKKDSDLPKEETPSVVIEKDNYIYDSGILKLLDSNDKELGKYECKTKDSEKCYVATLSNEDDFDTPKYLDSSKSPLVRTSGIYNNKYVFIYDDNKIVLYDIEKESSSGEYELIKTGNIDKDYVVYKNKNGKYGILEFTVTDVKELIEAKYEYLGIISNSDRFVVKENNKSYLIDNTGKILTAQISGDIKSFDDTYLSIYNDDYLLYDYMGNQVTNAKYDYITYNSGYVFVIESGRMYIYDKNLFKINENGLRIRSTDYNITYEFDENNSLKNTTSAFTIRIDNNIVVIEQDGKSEEFNLNEASLSKKTPFVSYSDGSLYFYQDDAKKELIGSYKCTNKNNVKQNSEEFTNCFVAKNVNILNNETNLGYTPIIGGQYVFINDTKEGATTPRIILYDLKAKEQKAEYHSVDTGSNSLNVVHLESFNNLIAAQNTSGNYGIIKIGANGATGVISFKGTKSISYFKDKYLLIARDDKNYLYDLKNLNEEVASSKQTIIDYVNGNLLVKDEKYTVYNNDGKIVKNNLDYVSFEADYFIGIIDEKINLYNYEANSTGRLEESVALLTKDTKYENFKVEVKNGYIISVLNDKGEYVVHHFDNAGKELKNEEE